MMIINFGRTAVDTTGIKNDNGLLVFQTAEQLVAYADKLAEEQANIGAEIDKRCPRTEGQIEEEVEHCRQKAADELGNAFAQSDKALGFKSLRAALEAKRDAFLQTPESETKPESDPSAHFIGLEQDQSVLSVDGAVQVGNTIYLLTQEREIKFATRAELNRYLTSSATPVTALAGAKRRLQASLCRTNVHSTTYFYCNENRNRIIAKVGHYWWFFSYRAYASTACQRKVWFFYIPTINFNIARVSGAVSAPEIVGCTVQNNNCNKQHFFNPANISVWNVWFSATQTFCVPTKTKSGWINGYHYSSCCPWSFNLGTTLKF
jgi:hypothetical protein